jgi:hypothetical protein
MAQLTDLDLDCLEYQTGFLSGMVMGSYGEPEQMSVYARRYAGVLALLGRAREYEYYALIADTASSHIGRAARKAWDERPLRHRLFAGRVERGRWLNAYTDSLFMEAGDRIRGLRDETADFRAHIDHYFDEAGARHDPVSSAPRNLDKDRI